MRKLYPFFILTILILYGCVEEFNYQIDNQNSLLVVEATITDEFKYQEIKLSNTYTSNSGNNSFEKNAIVKIIDQNNNAYNFKELDSGKYKSINKFKAKENLQYKLSITRANGKTYSSKQSKLTGVKEMDSIYTEKGKNEFGIDGAFILVDSYDNTSKSKFYRYEFEETKKIILPNFSNLDLEVVSDVFPYEVRTIPKTYEDRVCYKQTKSLGIIQTSTTNLSEDRVSKFKLNFLPQDDYFLIYGYSILVKQYIQSYEAYSYYKTLSKQSSNSNNFSQIQPGYIEGNVFSATDPNEKVIGFFEVTSISQKRIFFTYKDLYPNDPYPRFKLDCNLIAPAIAKGHYPESNRSPLIEAIRQGDYVFYSTNPDYLTSPTQLGPYLMTPKECSDCRTQGSNIKPDFWQ